VAVCRHRVPLGRPRAEAVDGGRPEGGLALNRR
jgi:hypothetical protein